MTKRNAPCSCGSGKRFKHCHGRIGSDYDRASELLRRRSEALLHERRLQQGFGKPNPVLSVE
ncbi:SEC-C domain-containing protein [Bradyrhizobium sp. 157]|nr:SEC-C domain-containing protein [Bradyrhizobium sp. 157]